MPRKVEACASEGCAGLTRSYPELPNTRFCRPCRERLKAPRIVPEVTQLSPSQYVAAETQGALRRALLDLERAKEKQRVLIEAAVQAARDAISALEIPPVPAPRTDPRKKEGEVAIAVLADWQLGKKTSSYNTAVLEQRINEYADKLIKLVGIQRADHPVRELRVYVLGDLVEGELIFPGQAHLIDASLFAQVLTAGPRILGGFLRRMAAHFEVIRVVVVNGNHGALGGRSRGDYHPESNADAMLYEFTRQLCADEKRITWAPTNSAGERHWYAVDRIGDKGFLLFHGDQIKGGAMGYPWYGFGKKISGWRNGGIDEPFDYSLSGHFHTPVRMLIGKIRHWGSGSTESDNTYAQEFFAARGTPSQWLLFAHPKRGVTAEYEVHLT